MPRDINPRPEKTPNPQENPRFATGWNHYTRVGVGINLTVLFVVVMPNHLYVVKICKFNYVPRANGCECGARASITSKKILKKKPPYLVGLLYIISYIWILQEIFFFFFFCIMALQGKIHWSAIEMAMRLVYMHGFRLDQLLLLARLIFLMLSAPKHAVLNIDGLGMQILSRNKRVIMSKNSLQTSVVLLMHHENVPPNGW